ncbi:MAG TPA: CRISPR-associated endonuclease Cas3'', partial [Solirubrobacterales bacterium]|nr:CRISPR-associated endonuclease Cas3'' [Solirubrobacterales bacterium]
EDDDQGAAPQELLDHLSEAHREAKGLLDETGLEQWSDAIGAAAALHDIGKAHWSFQRTLRTAMGMDPDADDGKLWGKSGARGGERKRRYLRHELAGALALRGLDGTIELSQPDLVAYLVAAHHGRVRLSIRPAPGEFQAEAGTDKRFALGVIEGDELPAVDTPIGRIPPTVLSLACMELGAEGSWTNAAAALRDAPDLGPFRLAFLEAVVRVADWRASA